MIVKTEAAEMKNKIKIFTAMILLPVIILAGCSGKSGAERYLEEEDAIMTKMMEKMGTVENKGNAALDFLYGMIPHHQSAIDMSQSYLKYAGKDGVFRDLAEDIISAQEEEIREMKNMIKRIENQNKQDIESEAGYLQEYNSMMQLHHGSYGNGESGTGNEDIDSAFAEGMSMHHQMAVDMSQAVLSYTDDEEVIDFAEDIIEMQEEEIAQMQGYLKGTGGSSHQGH